MRAITGGYIVYPGGLVDRGIILIKNGKIEYAGAVKKFDRKKYQETDIAGMLASPGLIDAHTHLGVASEGTGETGDDCNEMTDHPVTPHMRAIDSIDPADIAFTEAREAGVTSVMITPGSANVFGGSICVAKTYGRTADEMVIADNIGQKMAMGENPKRVYGGGKQKSPGTRMGICAIAREWLTKATDYDRKQKTKKDRPDIDIKLAALSEVISGKTPLRVHAHRADDIMTAIRIADEFGLKIVIEHATEAWKVADILADRKIPLNIGPTSTSRSKVELKDLVRDNAARCISAGCHVSLITDHPVMPIADLRTEAFKLVRDFDVLPQEALKCITENPAKTLGIDKKRGMLKKGMYADIAIMNGHPADPSTKNMMTLIEGETVYSRR